MVQNRSDGWQQEEAPNRVVGEVDPVVGQVVDQSKRESDVDRATPVAKPSKVWRLCCLGCCGVTVLLAAVMIPVTIYSIMPNMAQSNLNKGTIKITNSTVFMPNNLTAHPWIMQESHITMHSGAPIASTMKKFTQTMYAVDWRNLSWFGPNRTVAIGSLEFPEQTLHPGENHFVIKVNITVDNSHNKDCFLNSLGFTCFTDYQMYMVQYGGPAALMLQAEDVKIKTLGITLPGKFHTNKTMVCGKLPSPEHPLNVSALPECQHAGGCKAPASMGCNSSFIPMEEGIDKNITAPGTDGPFGTVVV